MRRSVASEFNYRRPLAADVSQASQDPESLQAGKQEAELSGRSDRAAQEARLQQDTSATRPTLSAVIEADHSQMRQWYQQYRQAGRDPQEQARVANELKWGMARHVVAEELVLFQQLENVLGDVGRDIVREEREDTQYIKERLKKLEAMDSSSDMYKEVLEQVMERLDKHMASEKQDGYLPKLEQALGRQESIAAARDFDRTVKALAPSRAQPGAAPSSAPFSLAELVTAPPDKIRDVLNKLPSSQEELEGASGDKVIKRHSQPIGADQPAPQQEVPLSRN